MTLEARLNKIIAEQKLSKREFAKRVGMSENYLYILTSNSRPGTKQNKTISGKIHIKIKSLEIYNNNSGKTKYAGNYFA